MLIPHFDYNNYNGVALDPNIQARFDSGQGVSLVGSDVSNWADADGRSFNLAQATAANRPTQTGGGGIVCAEDEFLTSDVGLNDSYFIAVFDLVNAASDSSSSGNLLSYANTTELVLGSNTGTLTNEVITYLSQNTFRDGVSSSQLNTDTGSSSIAAATTHSLAVMYDDGVVTEFTLDGTDVTSDITSSGGTRSTSPANSILSIGARSNGTRDAYATYYEIRFYSDLPDVAAEVSALNAKWGV